MNDMSERLGSIRTPWTDIVLAQQGDPATRARCLEMLAEKYHNPIRVFIQAALNITQPHRLDEVVQGYFRKFLEKDFLTRLDRQKGTLRGFFMASVKSFVLDEIGREGYFLWPIHETP